MFVSYWRHITVGKGIRYRNWLVALVFALGLTDVTFSQGVHHDARALVKASAVDPLASQYGPQDADKAYDQASATWMQLFGESAFTAARKPILTAIAAMQQAGWLAPNTSVVISMLDARGDFAQFDGIGCTVHVNIDDRGSSPIIAALGNLRSSVAFVAAHELAHCRFDTLPLSERFPDRQQLRTLGLSNQVAMALLNALSNPSNVDGSAALLTAYDESLADAVATIALGKSETTQQHFGTALEYAQSLRFGELFVANRGVIPTAEHQGGFVFEAVARTAGPKLTWRLAKQVAMQSVLLSSFYSKTEPIWFKTLVKNDSHQAQKLRRTWNEKAQRQMEKRRRSEDEVLFYGATSDALLSIDFAQYSAANSDVSPEAALLLWKEIAWINAQADQPARQPLRFHPHQKLPIQAIVARRDPRR